MANKHKKFSPEEKVRLLRLHLIEKEHKLVQLFENEDYKLVGLPFYNEKLTKPKFREKLEEALAIKRPRRK